MYKVKLSAVLGGLHFWALYREELGLVRYWNKCVKELSNVLFLVTNTEGTGALLLLLFVSVCFLGYKKMLVLLFILYICPEHYKKYFI